MKKIVIIVIMLVLPAFVLRAELISPEDRLYGLSLIWQEANYNFAFFDQVPDLDWDSAYRSYIPKVLEAETDLEYYLLLQKFTALLKDGHTNVWFPSEISQSRVRSYPWVLINRVDGKAYISNIGKSLQDQLPLGSVITHINGLEAKEYIRHNILPYIASSTEHYLWDQGYRNALDGKADQSIELKFICPEGNEGSISLKRDRWSREDQWIPDPNIQRPDFSFSWIDDNIALIEINTFEDFKIVGEWTETLPDLRRAQALIIDIRNNPGGNSMVGWTIASWLTDEALRTSAWRTREHRAAYKAWGKFDASNAVWYEMNSWYEGGEPRKIYPADGERIIKPIAVLQDHSTASAAEDFLVAIEKVSHIKTFGRPSNGSTGQPLILELPGGGGARICTKRDTFPDGRDFVGIGIIPDMIVEPSIEDVYKNRDIILKEAIEYLISVLQAD